MSRKGKQPVIISEGVNVEITPTEIKLSGKLGTQTVKLSDKVKVEKQDNKIVLAPVVESQESRTLWGTLRSLIFNADKGVSTGWEQELILKGVGYKASVSGQKLSLNLAFSHDVTYMLPEGVKAEMLSPTEIKLTSNNKELLGKTTAAIQKFRKPEPYKGKGIHKKGQYIRRKEGKKK